MVNLQKKIKHFPEIWIWTEEQRSLSAEEVAILKVSIDENLSILEKKYVFLRRERLKTVLEFDNFAPINDHSL